MRPSDILTPAPTDFPSPLPFSRLGVVEAPKLYDVEAAAGAAAFGRRIKPEGRVSVASGLGGRLFVRLGG